MNPIKFVFNLYNFKAKPPETFLIRDMYLCGTPLNYSRTKWCYVLKYISVNAGQIVFEPITLFGVEFERIIKFEKRQIILRYKPQKEVAQRYIETIQKLHNRIHEMQSVDPKQHILSQLNIQNIKYHQ